MVVRKELEGRAIGGYTVKELIGATNKSRVYRVEKDGLPFALKVVLDPLLNALHENEVRRLQQLDHPSIVKLHDVGEVGGKGFIVTDFVPLTLDTLLESGTLSLDTAVHVLDNVLLALEHVHTRGTIYQDLKPQNIGLRGKEVKLFDFNLGTIAGAQPSRKLTNTITLDETSVVIEGDTVSERGGTPGYLSPEQIEGRAIDQRTDVFAAGALLYKMLTGRLPVGKYKQASELNPSLPASVDEVIDRALQQDPAHRFSNATTFRGALSSIKLPVARASAPSPHRNMSFAKRVVVSAAATVLVGLVGIGGYNFLHGLNHEKTVARATKIEQRIEEPKVEKRKEKSKPRAKKEHSSSSVATREPEVKDPLPYKIAFALGEYGKRDIYTINDDGSGKRNLTNTPTDDFSPSFSPDGGKILFLSGEERRNDLCVMDKDGSNKLNLTQYPYFRSQHTWSPSGRKIAFAVSYDSYDSGVAVINANGTGRTQLIRHRPSSNPLKKLCFSPDGKTLAFESQRDGNNEIYTINLNGSGLTNLTNNSAYDYGISWSPDGRNILFASDRDDNTDIYIMDSDGRNQKKLTNNASLDDHPSFSPDGKRISFTSKRGSFGHPYLMDSFGGNQKKFSKLTCFPTHWSPDGTRLLFEAAGSIFSEERAKAGINTYVLNIASGEVKELVINNWHLLSEPVWSPMSIR